MITLDHQAVPLFVSVFVASCAAGPVARAPGDPPPTVMPSEGSGGAPNRLELIIGYPSGDPPCSSLFARVNGAAYLELGQFCGHLVEDREATEGIVNLRGYRSPGQGLLWELRALPTGATLVFLRRSEGSAWMEIASVPATASTAWLIEIQWPSDTWPTG